MKTEFYCNSSYEDRILVQFQFVEYRNGKLFFSVYLFEEAVHRKVFQIWMLPLFHESHEDRNT